MKMDLSIGFFFLSMCDVCAARAAAIATTTYLYCTVLANEKAHTDRDTHVDTSLHFVFFFFNPIFST